MERDEFLILCAAVAVSYWLGIAQGYSWAVGS